MMLVLLLALFKSIFLSHYGFGLVDEGESLHNASRILAGEMIYKNFFAVFPPLDNYYYAIVMWVFGKSILAPRVISSLIFTIGVAGLFKIVNKAAGSKAATITSLLLIFSDLSVERLFFFTPIFWAIYLCTSLKSNFWAGILLGIVSWFRFDLPATYLFALLLTTRSLSLLLGYMLPIAALILWLSWQGLVYPFIQQAVFSALTVTKLQDLVVPVVWDVLRWPLTPVNLNLAYIGSYYCLLVISFCLTIAWVLHRKESVLNIFLVSAFFTFVYVNGRTDIGHMVKGGMFLFVALGIWCTSRIVWLKLTSRIVTAILLFSGICQSIWWIRFNNQSLDLNGYKLRLNSQFVAGTTLPSSRTIESAVNFLQQSPTDQTVLAVPYMAGLYFLADRSAPTVYNNLLGGTLLTNEQQQQFVQELDKRSVNLVIYDPKLSVSTPGFRLQDYNPIVHNHIVTRFRLVNSTQEGWWFMHRI